MATVEASIEIRAPRERLFALSQSYRLRRDWDPFVAELRLLDGNTHTGIGVRVWVKAYNGLSMTVRYTVFSPPGRVAMQMTEGPWLFRNFAGTWKFEDAGDATRVTFRYGFSIRGWLAPLLTRATRRTLLKDIEARLLGLKRAAEQTDILERLDQTPD